MAKTKEVLENVCVMGAMSSGFDGIACYGVDFHSQNKSHVQLQVVKTAQLLNLPSACRFLSPSRIGDVSEEIMVADDVFAGQNVSFENLRLSNFFNYDESNNFSM